MVTLQNCETYGYDAVKSSIRAIFDSFGGIGKFVRPGMRVAVKPNLIAKKKPEESATTHPCLTRAVSELCKEAGGSVVICESPGGLYDKNALRSVYKLTGTEEAASLAGVELNYDVSVKKVQNPDGKYQKTLEILTPLADADIIIDVAKLKTHGMMVYTGAVKNMFGSIAGIGKAEYHFNMPDYDVFADTLIDIFLASHPVFSIIDAVSAMHKDGPTAGEPYPAGMIMGSDNAFELDRAAMDLIGAEIDRIPMAGAAITRGLMPRDVSDITFAGDLDPGTARERLAGFEIKYNDSRSRLHFVNGRMGKIMEKMIKPRPVFTKLCRSCSECARNCPVKAITVEKGKRARVDLDKCIRCYCCQELCPFKAVKIKRTLIGKLVNKI